MSASRVFYLSNQFCYVTSLNLKGACYSPALYGTFSRATMIHKKVLPFYIYKRHMYNIPVSAMIDVVGLIKLAFNFIQKIRNTNVDQGGHKEVYLLSDHFKYHEKVQRVKLVNSLSSTIQTIKGDETKVIYIVGLPGTGKKELARQYAELQYNTLKKRKNHKKFVATLDVSNPINFHQSLFKIAENADIIENYEQYDLKTRKLGGYKEMLLKLTSHLKNYSGWVLVLNDLKFNSDLEWRVGEMHNDADMINGSLPSLDLSDVLSGGPSDGTIIITTRDSFAKRHHAKNVKYFDMPSGMEDQEALRLLEFASGQQRLERCESAQKVIKDLQNVPSSVYW